ncbi:MAG: hypothetical protein GKR91_01385 [Pseudomonadales bacterium]|nr:hypothetical protein [Pseudomonadales bacterium]
MSINELNNIALVGMDWSNKLREIDVDMHLWNKICQWHGDEEKALKWVQLQIKLISNRHPERTGLSQIISSIAFVEMANPDHRVQHSVQFPVTSTHEEHAQSNFGAGAAGT